MDAEGVEIIEDRTSTDGLETSRGIDRYLRAMEEVIKTYSGA